jgi:hypothetical protein
MDAQSWGMFLLILGLLQVVLAGVFLRTGKAAGKAGREKVFWLWIGRLGSLLCVIGVLVIVTKT